MKSPHDLQLFVSNRTKQIVTDFFHRLVIIVDAENMADLGSITAKKLLRHNSIISLVIVELLGKRCTVLPRIK